MLEINKVWNMDCIEGMKLLPDNSVDSIVTDPPYWLSFMGKKWDYDVPTQAIREECLRVLKPWGYLLAFAGTRTQHRMAVRIEDAWFEIRDMIAWVYGSWFPKSLNIGKAIDKSSGYEWEIIEVKENTRNENNNSIVSSKNDCGWTRRWILKNDMNYVRELSDEAKQWEWRWTALKPALEPITVARKPLWEKTVAENALKWWTGGINIDWCRVGMSQEDKEMLDAKASTNNNGVNFDVGEGKEKGTATPANNLGRFPANFIHDWSDEVVDLFPNSKGGAFPKTHGSSGFVSPEEKESRLEMNDSWSASRFFYVAKASKSDRNEWCEDLEPTRHADRNVDDGVWGDNPRNRTNTLKQNYHPTVKPTDLMRYLTRLVTRKWWLVLDPFTWSWSTWKACKLEWFDFIWFELDEWYCDIANKRLQYTQVWLF